jgi:O-methyltransferase
MARVMPREARLHSLELHAASAEIARGILAHAGVDDRVTVMVGRLGDGGETIRTLKRESGFTQESLDLVFIDHDKNAYLPDLELILGDGWLHQGPSWWPTTSWCPALRPIVPIQETVRAHFGTRPNTGRMSNISQ